MYAKLTLRSDEVFEDCDTMNLVETFDIECFDASYHGIPFSFTFDGSTDKIDLDKEGHLLIESNLYLLNISKFKVQNKRNGISNKIINFEMLSESVIQQVVYHAYRDRSGTPINFKVDSFVICKDTPDKTVEQSLSLVA